MKIALTFDDGPNYPHTYDLLKVLGKKGIHATFFMVGKFVVEQPDIVRAVHEDGHWIGNHTFNHFKLTELCSREVVNEIESCQNVLTLAVSGKYANGPGISRMFRPPFMLDSPQIEKMIEEDLGLKTIRFHAAAGDGGEQLGADHFVEKIKRELNGQSGIVLMHDGGHEAMGTPRHQTVDATRKLMDHFKDAEFVSPLELM